MNARKKTHKKEAVIPFDLFKKYLAPLVEAEERMDFKAGQVVFYEGHYPYGVYVLRKGRLRFFKKKGKGKEKLLQIIEPTKILCEKEFLKDAPFEFSAKAETDVSLSFFSRSSLDVDKAKRALRKNRATSTRG